jgi:hypothetical protein
MEVLAPHKLLPKPHFLSQEGDRPDKLGYKPAVLPDITFSEAIKIHSDVITNQESIPHIAQKRGANLQAKSDEARRKPSGRQPPEATERQAGRFPQRARNHIKPPQPQTATC